MCPVGLSNCAGKALIFFIMIMTICNRKPRPLVTCPVAAERLEGRKLLAACLARKNSIWDCVGGGGGGGGGFGHAREEGHAVGHG